MEEVPLGSSKKMIATQQEMVDNRVPIPYRDQCAHLLIPLNKCRQSEFYLPWKCENERHSYEKCEYELVMERMLQMQKIKQNQELKKSGGVPLIPSTANASWFLKVRSFLVFCGFGVFRVMGFVGFWIFLCGFFDWIDLVVFD